MGCRILIFLAFVFSKIFPLSAYKGRFKHRSASSRPRLCLSPAEIISNGEIIVKGLGDVLWAQGLLSDSLVMGASNVAGDMIAQIAQQTSTNKAGLNTQTQLASYFRSDYILSWYDIDRTRRFGLFGLADGIVSHAWIYSLSTVVQGDDILDVLKSIMADSMIYTPLWCVWFLGAMAHLESRCMITFRENFNNEWTSLLKLTLGFYLPLNCIIYSVIPIEFRVIGFAITSLLYTIVVSIWSNSPTPESLEQIEGEPLENTQSTSLFQEISFINTENSLENLELDSIDTLDFDLPTLNTLQSLSPPQHSPALATMSSSGSSSSQSSTGFSASSSTTSSVLLPCSSSLAFSLDGSEYSSDTSSSPLSYAHEDDLSNMFSYSDSQSEYELTQIIDTESIPLNMSYSHSYSSSPEHLNDL